MRRLNLAGDCGARLERAQPRPCREVLFADERVFLDPGTLEAFAAESESEWAPQSCGLEPSFPPPRPPRTGPSAICLSVTHACNLACRYCYVRAKRHEPATMTRETAQGAIELLRSPGPWRIGFFGGEPLLAWDLVREIVDLAGERAQALGAKVRFSITTNGTLMTPDRAEFLARHGFSLIVSLDGPRELHDAERVTAGGPTLAGKLRRLPAAAGAQSSRAGSFDAVIDGLQIAAAAGLGARTTLRSTFPLARPELVARLQFLNALADDGFARAVSVEPAWPTTKDATGMDRICRIGNGPAPAGKLRRLPAAAGAQSTRKHPVYPVHPCCSLQSFPEYLAAARWAAGRIESGHRLRFHHMEKALSRILLMRPAGTECGAGFGYLEIAPSGEIHACHKAVGGAIGRVETGVSERLRAPWLDNRWCARPDCTGCWARNVCGGGCRAEALEHAGSVMRTWPVACAVKKAQVRAALYVAAACSRERLAAHLEPRARRPRRSDLVPAAGV